MQHYILPAAWLISGLYSIASGVFNFRIRLWKPVVDISIGRKWSNIFRIVSGVFLIWLAIWYFQISAE